MADSDFDVITLHEELDALWIRYLDLVDQYTQAQVYIKECLGKGFFSLAQANFASSGRRYGQDYYDQRAVASTRARIEDDGKVVKMDIITMDTDIKPKKETATRLPTPDPEDEQSREKSDEKTTHLATPEPEDSSSEQEQSEAEQVRLPTDPLRQFGILIPPSLRTAQKSFAKAVRDEHAVVRAINSAIAMRSVEVEIRKARKVLKKAERVSAVASDSVGLV